MRRLVHDRIAIGASAGGLHALQVILGDLPADLAAAIFVVIHRSPTFRSILADLLAPHTRLAVREGQDGEGVRRGVVYLAPPDHHMTLNGDRIALDRSPKQHHTRPAIDPLFRSVAASCGRRAVGVVLTGNLSDGAAGLVAIKAAQGLSVVQDPSEAEYPSMPWHALVYDHVDLIVPLAATHEVLEALVVGETVESIAARVKGARIPRAAP